MEEIQYCPQCPNHCPQDALQCGRGERFFARPGSAEGAAHESHGHGRHGGHGPHGHPGPKMDLDTPEGMILHGLRRCGHMLHHGICEPEELLAPLTAEERMQLSALLGKLCPPQGGPHGKMGGR